jgi:hypothetical protein
MKKPTLALRDWQARIARFRFEDRFRRGRKVKNSNQSRYIVPGEKISAPQFFNLLRGDGREVVKFLRATARAVLVLKKQVVLNFRNTEQFHVPATILLFAEIDRITSLSDLTKPITIREPIRRRPREVMKQIGLHNLTGDNSDVIPEREDVVYWKATKGNSQSGDLYGPLVEAVAAKANKDHVNQIEVAGLWRSVNEAVANSVDHAYKKPRFDNFSGLDETKWWMFSQIREHAFTIAVCDLGCGYRKTINERIPEKFIAFMDSKLMGANRDAIAIDTAMEYGRSGTHEEHRGKGSRDALSLLLKHGQGDLIVLSNTGWMRYSYENNREASRESGSLDIDIGGTIIWWNLPLHRIEHENH